MTDDATTDDTTTDDTELVGPGRYPGVSAFVALFRAITRVGA